MTPAISSRPVEGKRAGTPPVSRDDKRSHGQANDEGDRDTARRSAVGEAGGAGGEAADACYTAKAEQHDGSGDADHQAADQPFDWLRVGEGWDHSWFTGILR
jgi:hypothetical protein